MIDKTAIDALAKAEAITSAASAVNLALADGRAVALPNDFQVHDLEKYMAHRQRMRGHMKTAIPEDFAAYVEACREDGATVFIDAEAMTAVAVLNLGTPDKPGHADNRATLAMKRTAAYAAMLQIASGKATDQTSVAEWMEDWRNHLSFLNANQEEMDFARALAGVRRITIDASRKMESEVSQLSASRSALEKVAASAAGEPLPATIRFKCVPYERLKERTFDLRLAVLTGGDKVGLVLRVAAAERHAEEMAVELVELVRQALNDGIPALVGTYGA